MELFLANMYFLYLSAEHFPVGPDIIFCLFAGTQRSDLTVKPVGTSCAVEMIIPVFYKYLTLYFLRPPIKYSENFQKFKFANN